MYKLFRAIVGKFPNSYQYFLFAYSNSCQQTVIITRGEVL